MSSPPVKCVIVPFGTPADGAGLGLGLAAAIQTSVRMEGLPVGMARLQAVRKPGGAIVSPAEGFVSPDAWQHLASRTDGLSADGLVLTGVFEPPTDGDGAIRMLAFDAKDGRTRASLEAPVDSENAGKRLVDAVDGFWSDLGGDIGRLRGLRDLGWEPLESVLRAERCALHDPAQGRAYDPLAALLHMGRAIDDAPEAQYPMDRLVDLAGCAVAGGSDASLATAALRSLERAVADAARPFSLTEALGLLLIRAGRPRDAERRMNALIAAAPERARAHAVLSQALRVQGQFEAALSAAETGLGKATDAALHIERAATLHALGREDLAAADWREALRLEPLHAAAFAALAANAAKHGDTLAAQQLADSALAAPRVHPEVLRCAVRLILESEPEGIARASRLTSLCERLLEQTPADPLTLLVLARALLCLGERARARQCADRAVRAGPGSAAAAEAQALRLAIDDPQTQLALESVMRAAQSAPKEKLEEIAARARHLASSRDAWRGWLAAALAEGRQDRWTDARSCLDEALKLAPGSGALHLEMARVLLELGDAQRARQHVDAALASEGPTPAAHALRLRVSEATQRSKTTNAASVLRSLLSMRKKRTGRY